MARAMQTLGTRRGAVVARALASIPAPSPAPSPSPSPSLSRSFPSLRPASSSAVHHVLLLRPPRRAQSTSSSVPASPDGPLRAYEAELAAGRLRADVYQAAAATALQRFHERIHADDVAGAGAGGGGASGAGGGAGGEQGTGDEDSSWTGFLERWFSGGGSGGGAGGANGRREREGYGIYLYGGPGTGKTRLMDLLYTSQPPGMRKRRAHFHVFMLDVHDRMHRMRMAGHAEADPLPLLARELAADASLLCFDEFQVTDVADAMILKRLFGALFGEGVDVVFTSNRHPDGLYEHGLNRQLFLPFIAYLKEKCVLQSLGDDRDFRRTKEAALDAVYVVAATAAAVAPVAAVAGAPTSEADAQYAAHEALRNATRDLDAIFRREVGAADVRDWETNKRLSLSSGKLLVAPRVRHRTVWFQFADLCQAALGAGDYLALAREFDTVFIADIPRLDAEKSRNEMRRFITLIDILYESHTRLFASMAAPPNTLYRTPGHARGYVSDEQFAFDRTVSRLLEMQSTSYLAASVAASTRHP